MRAFLLLTAIVMSNTYAASVIDQVRVGEETVEFTNGYNLERCLEFDRFHKRIENVDQRTCSGLRNHYANRAKAEDEARQQGEENQKRADEFKLKVEQARLEKEQQRKEADVRFAAKYAAEKAEREKQEAADERAERAEQKRQAAAVADMKARCGGDYKSPSIGMRIERAQECVAPVKLVSQINRADGVVSTYRSGSLTLHVMSGRVMAWDR